MTEGRQGRHDHPQTLEQVGRALEEVGPEFRVARERIRQIESKTLAKLRHQPGAAAPRIPRLTGRQAGAGQPLAAAA